MQPKKQICLECKKEFEVSPRARFKRKYCPECSEKRKKMWDDQWKLKIEDFDDDDDDEKYYDE
jgi:Zn finger protein HypA/HybF involved in hydrogenase expression